VRLFPDTNVWVGAFAAAGLCEALLDHAMEKHEVLTAPLVWEELRRVLVKKLRFNKAELAMARFALADAEWVDDAPASAGNNDRRLIAAAAAARADLFVTGDKALLERGQAGAMRIVAPRQAWLILVPPAGPR